MEDRMPSTDSNQWASHVQAIRQTLAARKQGLLGYIDARKTAVLVTLQPNAHGELEVLFEHRAKTLRRQPGEISFPGGHIEPSDNSEADAAIREASEELGVSVSDIELVGALDVLPAGSSLLVYPFVGLIRQGVRLNPNPDEVAEVFSLSCNRLLMFDPDVYDIPLKPEFPEDFPYHLIPNGRNYKWRTAVQRQYFFQMDGWVIWGLTARILKHFLDLQR
ncbi:NUDIX hydrolase [Alicyclobacillus ferrooxydans]|nr:CoA pyrophosphatase [Alicyclobacillus ferrooxydans]